MAPTVSAPDPDSLLGRDSVSWQLREPSRLVGLPATVLLQLARPEIATAIREQSDFDVDPIGRFSRTIGIVGVVRFGSPDDARQTVARLQRIHRPVHGSLTDGRSFTANDPDLQLWVLATGIHVAIEVEARYVGALRESDRRRFYEEQLPVFDAFHIPRSMVPDDLGAFRAWMTERMAGLEVTEPARALGGRVARLTRTFQ